MDTLPRLKQGVLRKFLYILACCWGLVIPAFARDGGALRYVDMNGQLVLQLRSEISPSTKADNYVLITHQNQNSIALTRTLGARGDVVFKDVNKRIRLRQTLLGGVIFYPDDKPKGIPLIKESVYTVPISEGPQYNSIDDWQNAYPYAGDIENPSH